MEWIKTHKIWVAGIAIAIVVFLYVKNASSGGVSAAPGTTADTASADAIQQAMISANAQGNQNATALQAQTEQDSTQLALAKIQADTSTNANELSANIASQQINATAQYAALHDTLTAQVATGQQQTQVQLQSIATNGQSQQLATVVGGLVQMNTNQTNASNHAIDAAAQVATSCHGIGCWF